MIKREIYNEILTWLPREEIIFLSGPRQVGKTTLLKIIQKKLENEGETTFFFNLENPNDLILTEDYQKLLKTILKKNTKIYLFLDEIQLHSKPSNFLKYLYDEHRESLKLIITGSANLELKAKIQDSLVGRKKTFHITPFSFTEFLEAKEYSEEKNPITEQKNKIFLLEEYLLYGGLPKIALETSEEIKKELLFEYINTYINKDVRILVSEKNILHFNKLIIFLAKSIGNLVNYSEISREIGIHLATVHRYIDILKHTFIFDFLSPYYKNEITRIKKSEKIYMFDMGVRNAILSNFLDLEKREDSGALFENIFFEELQKKYHRENIFYARNISGNEIDFITKDTEGKSFGYEIKYSESTNLKIPKGTQILHDKLHLKKTYLINKSFTSETKENISFLSFFDFLK